MLSVKPFSFNAVFIILLSISFVCRSFREKGGVMNNITVHVFAVDEKFKVCMITMDRVLLYRIGRRRQTQLLLMPLLSWHACMHGYSLGGMGVRCPSNLATFETTFGTFFNAHLHPFQG